MEVVFGRWWVFIMDFGDRMQTGRDLLLEYSFLMLYAVAYSRFNLSLSSDTKPL